MQIALKSLTATFVAASVSLFWAGPASADGGICIQSYALGSLAYYGSNPGCYLGSGFHHADDPGVTASVTTDPDPMPEGLTTGSMTLISYNYPAGGTTFADLEQGIVGTSAFAGPRAFDDSGLYDNLHYTITDGAPFAPITVNFSLRGSSGAEEGGNCINSLQLGLGGSIDYYSNTNPPSFGHQAYGWETPEFTNESEGGFDFTGVVNVIDGQNVPARIWLQSDCSSASANFAGWLSLTLPDNVRFTSDSGVFLSQTSEMR